MELGERIAQLRGKATREEFVDGLGIHAQTLYTYEKGKRQPVIETINKICNKYNVSADWLISGKPPMQRGHPLAEQTKEEGGSLLDETGAEMQFVPLVEARLSAGHGSLETSAAVQRQYAFRASFLRRRGNPAHMVLVRVSGDSMAPKIENRDVVLIDQSQKDLRPGHIYAVGVEDMVYLKQVDARPGQVVLSSVNEKYEPIYIDTLDDSESRIRIIGRAVWTCRELT